MDNLAWEDKEEIFREVQKEYDKEFANHVAADMEKKLTETQATEAAEVFARFYSSDEPTYDQMKRAVRTILR